MTKKHFETFAEEIRASNRSVDIKFDMARLVARVALYHNRNFDPERFYRACGLER